MTTKTRTAKQAKVRELQSLLKDLKWLGIIVTWNSGQDCHKQSSVQEALTKAGLDTKYSRELLPRHAFSRAARKLSDQRVIDIFTQNETDIVFQFTHMRLGEKEWEFNREAFVTLNKITGELKSDNHDLARQAQVELDNAMETRTTADITRIVQRLFEDHSDLIPIRDSGGVYFVPQEHSLFADQVEIFLQALGGRLDRIPVPEGTDAGNKAIQNAVRSAMEKLIEDHITAVKGFEVNTRKDTIERAAERIKETRVKIEAYAHYLGEQQKALLEKIKEANQALKDQVAAIGGGAPAHSEYEWDRLLDGKVYKLVQGEDFLGQAASMLTRARQIAKREGKKIRARVMDDGATIVLQAVQAE